MKVGFDNELYIKLQTESILKRIKKFNQKLYLEFGGKLFEDFHASRVLPGFDPNSKIEMLKTLSNKMEVIFCISTNDIERDKYREDNGTTYSQDALRSIEKLRSEGLSVSSIVITLFKDQPKTKKFVDSLIANGEKVYIHRHTKGYPTDVETIVSDEGYGANPYIETTMPLVVVTGPGPCSGKLATCLSQLYHEYKRGVKAGYAKFETFPIWNLSINHPVNIAYEAATADLNDTNTIDPFHYKAYGEIAINYNRDVESFPVLKNILSKISGTEKTYKSPTDMGVNMAGSAITNDKVVSLASRQEIIRRYYNAKCGYFKGQTSKDVVKRLEVLLSEAEINLTERQVATRAKQKFEECGRPVVAMEVNNEIITGKKGKLISASSACVLNAIKALAGIPDEVLILSEEVLKPILHLNHNVLEMQSSTLKLEDVLIALSISAITDENARKAFEQLPKLKCVEAHSTFMLSEKDEKIFKRLRVHLTCESKSAPNAHLDW